ncbi:K+-dependent Na+/Ca+ exchanger [Alloprevotella rava F0323]|uniref:K+-dependent Na+/Ca+ exchanger n=1 Tax=Alloprevotella rava F0323 TaxID=679199 RepID=G5GDM9_9BACT|nr:calcium/sodium antiporter [Alloprevotella rava]EHG21734.1 K+-dependent Na+/Ca+ exchanger [Alloprevotella rava F0323]
MTLSIAYILIGIIAVLWGADKFTDGAAAIARKMNIPEIVIGLTIVAMGTSAPELFTSVVSALKGSTGLALGNIVGSNIFNSLLIVGAAAAVAPISISQATIIKDIPFALVASLLLTAVCLDGNLTHIDSLLLLIGFALFLAYTLQIARNGKTEDSKTEKSQALWKSILFIIIGLGCLIVGSNLFVSGASTVAEQLGVSDAIIGLTIVAGGTSLPELATSIISARKGQSGIAIGNVVGSNVFNILAILGITGFISPMTNLGGITTIDLTMLILSIILVWAMSFTKYKIERWEGSMLIVIFSFYLGWLIYSAL